VSRREARFSIASSRRALGVKGFGACGAAFRSPAFFPRRTRLPIARRSGDCAGRQTHRSSTVRRTTAAASSAQALDFLRPRTADNCVALLPRLSSNSLVHALSRDSFEVLQPGEAPTTSTLGPLVLSEKNEDGSENGEQPCEGDNTQKHQHSADVVDPPKEGASECKQRYQYK
jgi:hypothetical protein